MRIIGTLLLIIIAGYVFGQAFTYPVIKPSGISISDFIPENWEILDSASGDLNNDKYKDFAFVLQHKDSIVLIKHEASYKPEYNDTIVTRPRMLVIAFYNIEKRQYDLTEQSNSFILCHDDPAMDEPFRGISIINRTLKIDFFIWYSIGSWYASNISYKFRYQDKEFQLIGADYFSFHRATGESEDRSYNFLTKKVKTVIGNISDEKTKTNWRNFQIKELKTFKTFIQPFTWEVETDFVL